MKTDSKIVVGELATGEGPLLEDHFLVVAFSKDRWEKHPINSVSAQQIIDLLEDNRKFRFVSRLSNVTELKSLIHYPENMQGGSFFEEKKCKKNVWDMITGGEKVELSLSKKIRDYFD